MYNPSKKNDLTLNIYKPYSIFPISLILNGQNKYAYAALTEIRGYFAPKKDFTRFVNENPEVLFDLLKRIYRGLDGLYLRLEVLMSGDAYLRILTHLIIYARRFGQSKQDKIIFDWHLTHHHLASQTGLARESVTKEIKKMQNKDLIGYSGKKMFINNLAKLEEECSIYIDK